MSRLSALCPGVFLARSSAGPYALRPVAVAAALLVALTAPARADVDEDFRNAEPLVCQARRVFEAETLDGQLLARMAAAGWSSHCYVVMYVAGDNPGQKDAVVLTVHGGAKGSSPSSCRQPGTVSATNAELNRAMGMLHTTLGSLAEPSRSRLTHNLDLLMVTNGDGAEIRRRWR